MRWFVIALPCLFAACGSVENFSLSVEFPDQAARDQTFSLRVMIIEHSLEANCQNLLSGQVNPGDEGFAVVDSIAVDYTGEQASAALELSDTGSYLFYAEAYDSEGLKILHGCEAAEIGQGDVFIYLVWLAVCETNADCDNDDLFCNGQTTCVDGNCAFEDTDCSNLIDDCNDAACDEEQDACLAVPLSDIPCADAYFCTVDDNCQAGICQSGVDRECSEAGGACVSDGVCDDDLDQCVGDPLAAGTPCEDGLFCTEIDTCDGSGACIPGDLRNCDDSEPCTLDSCSDIDLACANVWTEVPGAEGLSVAGTCDDLADNDCDGLTDFADSDCVTTCTDLDGDGYGFPGDATCPNGAAEDCDDDPAGCGADCYPGNPDVCDGNDNDCDALTADGDDDPSLNSDCDGPDSDLCLDDSYESCTGGQLVCSTGADDTEGPEGDPTCSDTIDNDCDGATDDTDSDCIEACSDNDGDGYGSPGDPACPNGSEDDCDDDPAACGADCYPGASEVCDGYDNDCDPATDDGSEDPLVAAPCDGPDSDLCEEGTYSCPDGALVCSDSSGDDLDLCNGADDDCDPGSADGSEDPLAGVPCDGNDSDLCEEGISSCDAGSIVCGDTTGDSLDLCNGNDDDCNSATADGSADPDFGDPCDGSDSDLCTEGTWMCAGASGMACDDVSGNTPDLCNGNDDDCNPATADGVDEPNLGDPCDGSDADLCTEGVYFCAGSSGLSCDDETGDTPDLCNGVDDDCNSATVDGVDETDFGNPCDGNDTDLCTEGTYFCAGVSGLACDDVSGNNTEICNGLDDDCNPATADGSDETNLGDPCDGPDTDLCTEGTFYCGGASGIACDDASSDTLDICNGLDDDCNVATADGADETGLGDPCDGSDTDLCTEGVYFCAGASGLACDDVSSNTVDICNGVDDDCNPATPDGFDETNLGDPCDGPDSDLCTEGSLYCNGASGLACDDTSGDTPDMCNGLDDDCDPATADGADEPTLGDLCDGGDTDLCLEGNTYCAGASGLACDDSTSNDLDICNGSDDDCNPATADGAAEPTLGDPCDGADLDLCEEGNSFCNGVSGMACSDASGDSNTILDGGFEAGTPSTIWTETSINFGTPLCTVIDCGLGGGTGPYQDDWWAWFGGIEAVETATISQDVIIPLEVNTLRWYMELPVCEVTAADWFEITIDGFQVYYTDGTDPLCNVVGYGQRSVDISAYADGLSHTILFGSANDALGLTNFFVDNVELGCQ